MARGLHREGHKWQRGIEMGLIDCMQMGRGGGAPSAPPSSPFPPQLGVDGNRVGLQERGDGGYLLAWGASPTG